jgi:DNA-binding response OmpR family regulator
MVTGLSGAMDRVRGSLAGCDAYLTKPLSDDELLHALRLLDPGLAEREPNLPARR